MSNATNLQQIFKRVSNKKLTTILETIEAVQRGIKPAFLFDVCSANKIDFEKLIDLINDSNNDYRLRVVMFATETFVINEKIFLENLSDFEKSIALVDVSHTRTEPGSVSDRVRSEIRRRVENVCRRLIENRSSVVDVDDLCANICPTTMFGIFLDYPIVYWFSDYETCGNCLSCRNLVVIHVERTTNSEICIFSFSYPESMRESLAPFLDKWKLKINAKDASLKFRQSVVNLSTICL